MIGGGIVYLECEDKPQLLSFYRNEKYRFFDFSTRYSADESTKYIQLLRFFWAISVSAIPSKLRFSIAKLTVRLSSSRANPPVLLQLIAVHPCQGLQQARDHALVWSRAFLHHFILRLFDVIQRKQPREFAVASIVATAHISLHLPPVECNRFDSFLE